MHDLGEPHHSESDRSESDHSESGQSGAPAFDPVDVASLADVPAERLEAEILAAAARVAAGTCAFLVMVGEFDRRGLHESWESVSTAQWLGWRCGIGIHAAREQVRVGRRLLELPVVREAFSVGRLSYSKVRAITRVAHARNEAALVDLALHGTAAQVEQACSRLRRVVDPLAEEAELADAERRERSRCSVSWYRDADGALVGSFRLAPEDGEAFTRAMSAAVDEHAPVVEGEVEPLERRRAAALVGMCSEWMASPDTGEGAVPGIVVELDVAALAVLAARAPDPGGCGASESASRSEPRTGPASEQDAADGAGSLDLGRSRREPDRALRRALRGRDRHCRFPGCPAERGLQAHHIIWWSRGGTTDLQNLVLMCSKHHHAVHDRRWICTGTADSLVFERPDGRAAPVVSPPLHGTVADLVAGFEAHGLDVAVTEPGGRWYGDQIDWDCFFAAMVPISQPLAASAAD